MNIHSKRKFHIGRMVFVSSVETTVIHYRGRVILASESEVTIRCEQSGEGIVFRLSENEDLWRRFFEDSPDASGTPEAGYAVDQID